MIQNYRGIHSYVQSKKEIRSFFYTLLIVLFSSVAAIAQNMVTGKVSDARDGSGLPGVSVTVKGTSRGVTTDIDGNYKIQADNGQSVVFSFVGYISQTLSANASVINVSLSEDVTQLQDVVVVGYGDGRVETRDINQGTVETEKLDFVESENLFRDID